MKTKKLFEELKSIIESAGITLRKDILRSRGGYCILDNNRLIIINKMLPEEAHCRILAMCIGELDIMNSSIFIPPAVRDYIENKIDSQINISNVEIKAHFDN